MPRRRAIISAVLVALGAIAYGASPIDLVPELITGPLGLGDDLAVWVGAGLAIWKLLTGSQSAPGPTPPPEEQPRWEQKLPE